MKPLFDRKKAEQEFRMDDRANIKTLGYDPLDENLMTKRFFAACMAMQGILSKYNDNPVGSIVYLDEANAVRMAYRYADELIRQEDAE